MSGNHMIKLTKHFFRTTSLHSNIMLQSLSNPFILIFEKDNIEVNFDYFHYFFHITPIWSKPFRADDCHQDSLSANSLLLFLLSLIRRSDTYSYMPFFGWHYTTG